MERTTYQVNNKEGNSETRLKSNYPDIGKYVILVSKVLLKERAFQLACILNIMVYEREVIGDKFDIQRYSNGGNKWIVVRKAMEGDLLSSVIDY